MAVAGTDQLASAPLPHPAKDIGHESPLHHTNYEAHYLTAIVRQNGQYVKRSLGALFR